MRGGVRTAPDRRGHAVVVGASIAGLLAARVLADHYDQVTVLDRDRLPDGVRPRRGVPQSRQVHALLSSGGQAMEELLPGFLRELVAKGAVTGDGQADHHMYLDGRRIAPAESGLTLYCATRPLIESVVRSRVAALPRVEVADGRTATGLLRTGDRLAGVLTRSSADGANESRLTADLVVDAGGRGSRAEFWLEALGLPRPAESSIRPDVVYATRHYAWEPTHLGGRLGSTVMPTPWMPRGGVAIRQEDGILAVVLGGMLGEEPPADDAGFLAFARSLPVPDVADVVFTARPLTAPVRMRYPASRRRHYERLPDPPEGFLAVGDALCSFNPLYGQGMAIAALEARILQRVLAGGVPDMPRRFFTAAARLVDGAWELAAANDLRYPRIEGDRGRLHRVADRYLDRYRAATSVDAGLGTAFLRVAHLLDPPARLLTPGRVLRVLRHGGVRERA